MDIIILNGEMLKLSLEITRQEYLLSLYLSDIELESILRYFYVQIIRMPN